MNCRQHYEEVGKIFELKVVTIVKEANKVLCNLKNKTYLQNNTQTIEDELQLTISKIQKRYDEQVEKIKEGQIHQQNYLLERITQV